MQQTTTTAIRVVKRQWHWQQQRRQQRRWRASKTTKATSRHIINLFITITRRSPTKSPKGVHFHTHTHTHRHYTLYHSADLQELYLPHAAFVCVYVCVCVLCALPICRICFPQLLKRKKKSCLQATVNSSVSMSKRRKLPAKGKV